MSKCLAAAKLLKICGKEYGSDRPMKRTINLYLKMCIERLLVSPSALQTRENIWALVLDTEELLTTDALISSGLFERRRILIPNPSQNESEGIAHRCPGIGVHQCTTHELCADDCSLLRQAIGPDGALGLVFLDYNGRYLKYFVSAIGSCKDHTFQSVLGILDH
jgi:hypothetical protein